jgi:hypothetical protein
MGLQYCHPRAKQKTFWWLMQEREMLLMSTRGRLVVNVTDQHITIYLQHRPNKSFKTYHETSSRVRCRFLLSFFFFLCVWGYWHCGYSWPIVPSSGDSEDDCGEADGM